MTDSPTPVPPTPKKRTRSAQDQKEANLLNERRTTLVALRANTAAVGLLTPRGYADTGLQEGVTLADALQTAFDQRQLAIDAAAAAQTALDTADQAARDGYKNFRKIVNGVFKTNATARTALGADGRIPGDREKFTTTAQTVYDAALARSTYLTALAKRGYDEAALTAEVAKLTALTAANATFKAADKAATEATAQRKAAARAFDLWWAEFSSTADVALHSRPDLRGLLKP